MKQFLSLRKQLRSTWRTIAFTLAVSALLLGAVLFLHVWRGIPVRRLTQDPVAVAGVGFFIGFLSQAGIFFWSASATVCFFSATVISGDGDSSRIKAFLFVSGLLTLLLAVDDAFLLHEAFFPYLGVPETVVFAFYGAFVLFYLVIFQPVIMETEYLLLLMAFAFFGFSIATDLLKPPDLDLLLFEDGTKLVGIVSWLSYFFRVGAHTVNHSIVNQVGENKVKLKGINP